MLQEPLQQETRHSQHRLTGQLGLTTYHVCEPELKKEFDPAVYDEQVGMMEMVLDVDDIVDEMSAIRNEYCKYL